MTWLDEKADRVIPLEVDALDNEGLRKQTAAETGAEPLKIGRRKVVGISLATVVELMLARVFTPPALADTPQRNQAERQLRPSLRQLPPAEAMAYVKNQLARNPTAQRFKQEFENQKYQFILERAKVFVVGDQTLAILPSLVPVKRTDPFHRSVSIAISSAGTVAGGARISHSPVFQVTEFTLYYFAASGELKTSTVTAETLAAKPAGQIVKELGVPPGDLKGFGNRIGFNPRVNPATKQDLNQIIALFYQQTIADKWVKPLYPPEGVRSMLGQIPLIQKFSEVNGLFYRGILSSQAICLCTSTSSNICTSSSIIINLDL